MTRQNIIKYASACREAYSMGQPKPDREEWERLNTVPRAKHYQEITGKYAAACRMAYARGEKKPDFEAFKQQYNIKANTVNIAPSEKHTTHNGTTKTVKDNIRRQEKTLKEINVTIRNVTQQADILDDFFQELAERYPEYRTYHKLSDYIFGSILDIQEKLKTL